MNFNKENVEKVGHAAVEISKVVGVNIGSEIAVEILKVIIRGIH